ncbi:MAG: crossover junction endodeoxyribonuclease RuvC [Candidatus Neomarinimicrobiota bacterium]
MTGEELRVLGVDHGINRTGYAIVTLHGSCLKCLTQGTIVTSPSEQFNQRLKSIYTELTQIIKEWQPSIMAVEEAIYAQNVKTALLMGHARGAVLLAGANNDIAIAAYTPKKIKLAVVGNGAASKEQVQFMVSRLLNLPQKPESLDAADAMAVAICHLNRQKFAE